MTRPRPTAPTILADPPVKAWLATVRAGTRSSYSTALRAVADLLGATTAAEIGSLRRKRILRLRDQLAAKYRPGTAANRFAVAASLCRYLAEREAIPSNPFAGVRNVAVGVSNVPDWNALKSEKDVDAMLAHAANPSERAVVVGLLCHGFRASELASLRWSNVTTENGRPLIQWTGKGDKQRRQYAKPDFLDAARAVGHGELLVATSRGKPYSRQSVYEAVRVVAARAGVRVTPHGLRATFIMGIIRTRGIADAQKLAGHAWITTTQRYDRREVLE